MDNEKQIELTEPEYIKLQDINLREHGYNVYVKVIESDITTAKKRDGSDLVIINAKVADETGSMEVTIRSDPKKKYEDLFKKNSVICIRNGKINYSSQKNRFYLTIDLWGKITNEQDYKIEGENLKQDLSQPLLNRIIPGKHGYNLYAKILSCSEETITLKNETKISIINGYLGDQSAKIKYRVRADRFPDLFQNNVNKVIFIRVGKSSVIDTRHILEFDKRTKIQANVDFAIDQINEKNDMSALEYVTKIVPIDEQNENTKVRSNQRDGRKNNNQRKFQKPQDDSQIDYGHNRNNRGGNNQGYNRGRGNYNNQYRNDYRQNRQRHDDRQGNENRNRYDNNQEYNNRQRGQYNRQGGHENRQGGYENRQGGYENRQGGYENRQGGYENRQGQQYRQGQGQRQRGGSGRNDQQQNYKQNRQ